MMKNFDGDDKMKKDSSYCHIHGNDIALSCWKCYKDKLNEAYTLGILVGKKGISAESLFIIKKELGLL